LKCSRRLLDGAELAIDMRELVRVANHTNPGNDRASIENTNTDSSRRPN
jgi:hypothetical protein